MGTLKCTLCCGESFGSTDELRSHLKNVLDNLFCSCCSRKFNSIQALLDHYAPHCNTVEVNFVNGLKENSAFSIQHSPVELNVPPKIKENHWTDCFQISQGYSWDVCEGEREQGSGREREDESGREREDESGREREGDSEKLKVIPKNNRTSGVQEIIVDVEGHESDKVKSCASEVVKQESKMLKKDVPGLCDNCYPCICKDHTPVGVANHVSHNAKESVASVIDTNDSGIVQNHTPDLVDNPAPDDVQNNSHDTAESPDSGITENDTNSAAENQTSDSVEANITSENQTNVVESHNIFGNPTDDIVVGDGILNCASQIMADTSNNAISVVVESSLDKRDEINGVSLEIENLVYQCSCGMYFSSLTDHLMTYHCGEEVIVKGELERLKTIEEANESLIQSAIENAPEVPLEPTDQPQVIVCDREKQKDDEEKTCKSARAPLTPSQIEQLDGKVEECLDKEGRLYLRKFVRVEKFWTKKDEEKAAQMKYRMKNYDSVRDVPVGSVSINSKDEAVSESHTGGPKKLYQCNKCLTTFQTMFHFRYHVCCVTKTGTPTACNLCGHESTSAKELKAHWRMHQRQRRAAATALWEMQAGEVVHSKGNTEEGEDVELQCDRCGKMYKKSEVLIHVAMHDEQPPYKCPKCELSYDSRDKLTRHARTHREQKNHACVFCDKSFTDSNAFKLHMRSHTGEKPFECRFCSKKFSRPYERMKHERIHTGERPHVCDICGKTFRVSYCLTLHKRTHSGDRPYSCETCGKRFKAHSAFKHHVQIHSEDRNYKCPYCPKAFKTMVHLAGHKKTHTKPFLCSECNRRFASLYSVKAHMESHKNGENRFRYRCFVCGASYARAFALHAHMRTHGTSHPPEDVAEVLEIREEEPDEDSNMPGLDEELVDNKIEDNNADGEDCIRMEETL